MHSGLLRHRITIEASTPTQNGFGELVESWATFIRPWARVQPVNGREFFAAKQINAERTLKFTIRYQDGITMKMRINYDSRLFDINAILDIEERHKELTLMATEHNA
jgi:SPP1 family predicted phage head-tail adaptor